MFKSAQDAIQYIKKNKITNVDLKTCDLFGRWRHLSTPAGHVDQLMLKEGFGFDGSSYGFRKVEKSDMILIPDLTTGFNDPFWEQKTLSFICNIHVPEGDEPRFDQDPRFVCEKAENFLYETGIGDRLYLGPEYEFYLFDSAEFTDRLQNASYAVESSQAPWSSGGNKGYLMPLKGGYHGEQPEDANASFRGNLVELLENSKVKVKYHHHEVGGPGQMEIETEFDTPTKTADQAVFIKYATKNLARRMCKTATFMPKPMFGAPGSGLHVHFKLFNGKKPVFSDPAGYSGMSKVAMNFMTGILVHARSISAFANPSTNSYKRLIPGYEAPVSIVMAQSNRSAAIRIPGYVKDPIDKRFEYRAGDATANPYLMFAAMMMAGIDGIKRKLEPGKEGVGPFDGNIYELSDKEKQKIRSLPKSLQEALDALRDDHDYLLAGNVFSRALIETWIKRKTDEDVLPVLLRPHPYEFILSYGC